MPEQELLQAMLKQHFDDLFSKVNREEAYSWIMGLKVSKESISFDEVCDWLDEDVIKQRRRATMIYEGKVTRKDYDSVFRS